MGSRAHIRHAAIARARKIFWPGGGEPAKQPVTI